MERWRGLNEVKLLRQDKVMTFTIYGHDFYCQQFAMECLDFSYNGLMFKVYLGKHEIDDIRKDPKKLDELKINAYNNYMEAHIPEENSKQDDIETQCGIGGKTWNTEKTKLLISLRLEMEPQFIKPVCKKNKLWTKLTEKFNELKQTNYSSIELDTKYRNLLQTYRANKIKKNKTGEAAVTWEYFNMFDEILGNKISIIPPEETLGGNYILCSPSTSSENEEPKKGELNIPTNYTKLTESSDDNEEKTPRLKKKKAKEDMSVNKYLLWKVKAKEKENEYKKQKWEDTKKLKEQELKIFADLVNALNKNKHNDD